MRKTRHRSSVSPRRLILAALIAAVAVFGLLWMKRLSADDARDCTDDEIALATQSGRDAASKVVQLPAGSMQREGAILHLRARETELIEAGYPSAAEAFAAGAEEILVQAGIIIDGAGQ